MLDSTATQLLEYAEAIERMWFESRAVDCPGCGELAILPLDDYLCRNCRSGLAVLMGHTLHLQCGEGVRFPQAP
jgi:hypothetical protein